jgi:periplasmic protein TonB
MNQTTMSDSADFSANNNSLLMAIAIAVLLHIIIVVSIHFPKPDAKSFIRDIDVTIITAPSPKAPEHSQFLAQDHQLGAAEQSRKTEPVRPMLKNLAQQFKSSAQVKPVKVPPKKMKPMPQIRPVIPPKPIEPPPEEQTEVTPLEKIKPDPKVNTVLESATKIKPIVQKQTTEQAVLPEVTEVKDTQEKKQEQTKEEPEQKQANVSKKETYENYFGNEPPKKLSAASLQDQIAQLGNEIQHQAATTPRIKAKSANQVSSHKSEAALYLKDWETKVERIGNLNYPAAAIKPGFSATLTMEVLINMDGSINSMRITQSSGNPELDEAAKNIVRMSAPFPPLPMVLHNELDVLKITRSWKFSDESIITQ